MTWVFCGWGQDRKWVSEDWMGVGTDGCVCGWMGVSVGGWRWMGVSVGGWGCLYRCKGEYGWVGSVLVHIKVLQ